ncbi:uncharacterized protein LAESUDRAFT_760665 [Laetiporus sulphureus 93-53]|uniref:Protein YOP1 n=1 Tax=Laetiporus sulphureus 93-53 TaxID=1314785 RepID=A0A165DHZ0_9APHY|nr:uncharacterized protein LAESUDRAFT_760665 [Laetiporus sulphureus 93-53]KZT04922.1 hypothetical protein LAESUDRAFT_760665 [Laetiporus sulphureus 93-53]
MLLLYFTTRIISGTAAFLYPGYASYKTLSQRPASEEELERWLMYWSVLGCIVAVEYMAEWLVSWYVVSKDVMQLPHPERWPVAFDRLPLYYPIKTVFLLYLSLPQTAGAAYLYRQHLRPFFASHEREIDSALAKFKAYIYASLQRMLRAAWAHVTSNLGQSNVSIGAEAPIAENAAANAGAPPTLGDPMSGPAQLMRGLWANYGPGIIASGTIFLTQAQTSAARAQKRAERTELSEPQPYDVGDDDVDVGTSAAKASSSVPMPSASSSSRRSSESSSIRQRSGSGTGKSTFEEVEIPSDMEGEGHPVVPSQTKRTSWFSWGSSYVERGYENVKTD